MNQHTLLRCFGKAFIAPMLIGFAASFSATGASASQEDDVRAVFDQFVKAQNAHDLTR